MWAYSIVVRMASVRCMSVWMDVCPSTAKTWEPLHIFSWNLVWRCIMDCRWDFVQMKLSLPKICKWADKMWKWSKILILKNHWSDNFANWCVSSWGGSSIVLFILCRYLEFSIFNDFFGDFIHFFSKKYSFLKPPAWLLGNLV